MIIFNIPLEFYYLLLLFLLLALLFFFNMDFQVSWIRRKAVQQLLTVGLSTYASDGRFQAIHFHHSEDWTLQIKYVQSRDAGIYECQVSTHPPASIFLFLEVVGKLLMESTADGCLLPLSYLSNLSSNIKSLKFYSSFLQIYTHQIIKIFFVDFSVPFLNP